MLKLEGKEGGGGGGGGVYRVRRHDAKVVDQPEYDRSAHDVHERARVSAILPDLVRSVVCTCDDTARRGGWRRSSGVGVRGG